LTPEVVCLRCELVLDDPFLPCPDCARSGIAVNGTTRYADSPTAAHPHLPLTMPEASPTPLEPLPRAAASIGARELLLKDESGPPTWSYKDRLARVAAAHAQVSGASVLVASSSGNHGAAVASAASGRGLHSVICTLSSIAAPMRVAIEGAGGVLVPFEHAAQRWDVMRAAVGSLGWYPASNFHDPPIGSNPYAVDGYKEIAWEIVATLGDAPDWIVVPVGYGDGLAGIVRGFEEAVDAGIASRLPAALAAVTSEALPDALRRGVDQAAVHPVRAPHAPSITGGFGTYQALHAIRLSKGAARSVDDAEAIAARTLMSRTEGRLLELSSAVAFAALAAAVADGTIDSSARIVVVGTSTGLKDPPLDAGSHQLMPVAPTLAATLAHVDAALKARGTPLSPWSVG
jgi:threonine synthase